MTRCVCATTPSGSGALSSVGEVGICPVTKTQPSLSLACENGATGVGACGIIQNVGPCVIPLSPFASSLTLCWPDVPVTAKVTRQNAQGEA
jgi:hypothetical protein